MSRLLIGLRGCLVVLLLVAFVPGIAGAAEKSSVAAEILKILYENGDISSAKYRRLLKLAQEEEQRRLQAAAARQEPALEDAAQPSPRELVSHWDNGLHLRTADQRFQLTLGGRLLVDGAYLDADAATGLQEGSGVEIRQGRLYLKGTLYERFMFKAQYDFAGGDVDFKDNWLAFKDVPYVGHIKLGHLKEPFSLEELTSRKYITFMERSLPGQAGKSFVPARNVGVMVYDTAFNQRLTWAVGGFRETDGYGNDFSDEKNYNLTGRLTGLPWYGQQGRQLLHLGLAYSHKWLDNASTRLRARPEGHLADYFVDTGDMVADSVDLLGTEAAWVQGPWSLQGEYMYALVDAETGGEPEFSGYYLQGSYFLTGEHRPYKKSAGAFGRVAPRRSFDPARGGWGAWEIGVRYAAVDLTDAGVKGGEAEDVTLGLNWYLYPNLRLMLNYINADVDAAGSADMVQFRSQLDF